MTRVPFVYVYIFFCQLNVYASAHSRISECVHDILFASHKQLSVVVNELTVEPLRLCYFTVALLLGLHPLDTSNVCFGEYVIRQTILSACDSWCALAELK